MPSPTTLQPHEARQPSGIQSFPKTVERSQAEVNPLVKFLKRELKFWQADLKKRQREGEYYLEWLDWSASASISTGAASLQDFQELVLREIPSLAKLIYNLSASLGERDLDQLLLVQQTYAEFCDRYDQIKLIFLSEINWGRTYRIY